MQYTRAEYPDHFTVAIRTQEDAIALQKLFKELGVETIGSSSTAFWEVYHENTVYFIDGKSTCYGSMPGYITGMEEMDSCYQGYTYYASLENFEEGVSSLLLNNYEIY